MAFLAFSDSKSILLSAGYDVKTALEYAQVFMTINNITATPVEDVENGWASLKYTGESNGLEFTYLAYIIEKNDCFWVNQFCIESKDFDKLSNQILTYAKSINITTK